MTSDDENESIDVFSLYLTANLNLRCSFRWYIDCSKINYNQYSNYKFESIKDFRAFESRKDQGICISPRVCLQATLRADGNTHVRVARMC